MENNQLPLILAVDDYKVNTMIITKMLTDEYRVETAENGDQAIQKAIELKPDLILLDIMMPVKDGLTACRELKSLSQTADIPIIFLTAKTDTDNIVKGLEAGALDYVCKPFNHAELKTRIKNHIALSQSRKSLARAYAERLEAQTLLEEKTETLRLVTNNVSDAIILCNQEGKILMASPSTSTIFHLDSQSDGFEGKMLQSLAAFQNENDKLKQFIDTLALERKKTRRFILRDAKSGKAKAIECRGTTIIDSSNRITGFVIDCNNITAKLKAELVVRKNFRVMQNIFDYCPSGIATLGKNLHITKCNSRFKQLIGIENSIKGKTINEVLDQKTLSEFFDTMQKISRENHFETIEIPIEKDNGTKSYIEATISAPNPESNSIAWLIMLTDITKQKNLDRTIFTTVTTTEERERTRMARELHDGIGALLSSINIYINLILSGSLEKNEILNTLELTKQLLAEAIQSTKEIANNLHPVILTRFGLVATIKSFLESLEKTKLAKFEFNHNNFTKIENKNLELTIYRIIHELVNNTIKYAKANKITINLSIEGANIKLDYADDGIGFDLENRPINKNGGGMGLSNITGRVKSLNGTCFFKTKHQNGLQVFIEIPYIASEEPNTQI